MSRSIDRRELLVIVVAVLAVTAVPASVVSATDALVVGSQHETASELSNGQLSNLTVKGSGESGIVTLVTNLLDGFEDGDIAEYSGDTGSYTVQSSPTIDGSYTLNHPSDTNWHNIYDTNDFSNVSQGDSFNSTFRFTGSSNADNHSSGITFGVQSETTDGGFTGSDSYVVLINDVGDDGDHDLQLRRWNGGSDTVLKTKDLGVSLDKTTDYTINVDWQTDGTITVSLHNSTSKVDSITATDTTYTSGGIGWVGQGQSTNSVTLYDNFEFVGGESFPGEYLSANHSVSTPEVAAFNVSTASNVSVTLTAEYYDGNSWTAANSTTVSAAGNHTLDLPSVSSSTWRANVTVEQDGSDPAFEFGDDSILFANHHPQVDNASASPSGGETVSETPVELSINVSDGDFGTAQGENVSVEIQARHVDDNTWSTISTQTISTNQTVSTSYDPETLGEQEWRVITEDDYGGKTTSKTFSFVTPNELVFRSERNTSEILDNVQVNVTAYYGDETIRKNTTDGSVSLSGFPSDEPVIIRANGENYTSRTAVLESIYEQTTVFLLEEDVATHQVRFDMQDPTGEYARDETVLFVERDLELNGSVEWRVITGDNFGVRGVPITLEADERYRLRVKNLETGTSATIGAYTAIQNETVTLSPGSATIDVVDSERDYGWSTTENETGEYILFEYFDDANATTEVTLTIHERFNKSNVIVDNTTFTDANSIVFQQPLTSNQSNKTWMAEIYVDRNGTVHHFREPITGAATDIIPIDLDESWRSGIGVFVLLITGMAFTRLDNTVGAVGTALVGGMLWQVGMLSTITIGPAVVLAIAISIVYHYRTGGEP